MSDFEQRKQALSRLAAKEGGVDRLLDIYSNVYGLTPGMFPPNGTLLIESILRKEFDR